MTDVELLVRETLARHEAEVPTMDLIEVAPVGARTRRRQARNLLAAGLVAAILVLGAASGLAAILRAEGRRPATEPTPTPTIPPSPTTGPSTDIDRVALPPSGAQPSQPEVGEPIITVSAESYSGEHEGTQTQVMIFADGRMIWRRDRCDFENVGCVPLVRADASAEPVTGWIEQRLTPTAASTLRNELLATGFFERDHRIEKPFDDLIDWFTVSMTVDGRTVTVSTNSNLLTEPLSSRQTTALSRMEDLVADPSSTLPDSAFADRRIRAFVPSSYTYSFRWKPTSADLAELPPPADTLVHGACGSVTTEEARSIVQALDAERFRRLSDRSTISYVWRGDQERQRFRLEPELPDGVPRC